MKKIIVLSRVSTEAQHLDSQTKELIAAAVRLGYPEESHIIIEGIESAIKLSESDRVTLNKMKSYIEKDSDIDCVICWEPSRLSRQQKTLYSIRDYLLEHRIQLYILNPFVKLLNDSRTQIDTTASIVFSLFATISENEMMIKKERFMRAKNEMRKQGKKNAGAVVFGYMKDKDKYCIPHPLHSKVIAEIFNYYANNPEVSLYATYQYATSQWPDLFPVKPYVYSQHKIGHFFQKEYYWKGNWCYPPLVSEEIADKVHEKLKNAQCQPRFNSKYNYIGRGKVYCKHCGKMMTPSGGRTKAYNCSTDKEHRMTIAVDIVDWIIWEEARVAANIAASIDNSTKIREMNEQIKSKKNMIEQYDIIIEDLKSKQEKLLSLYLEGKINDRLFNSKNDDLKHEIEDNEKQKNQCEVTLRELETLIANGDELMNMRSINYDNITDDETKIDIVSKTIDKVYIEKIAPQIYTIEFTYKNIIVPQIGLYRYRGKGGRKKIWRINADGTEDFIYNS